MWCWGAGILAVVCLLVLLYSLCQVAGRAAELERDGE